MTSHQRGSAIRPLAISDSSLARSQASCTGAHCPVPPAQPCLAVGEARIPRSRCGRSGRPRRNWPAWIRAQAKRAILRVVVESEQPAELRPVVRRLQHGQLDEPAVGWCGMHRSTDFRRLIGARPWVAPAGEHRHVHARTAWSTRRRRAAKHRYRRLTCGCPAVQRRRHAARDRDATDVVAVRTGRHERRAVGVGCHHAVGTAAARPERRRIVCAGVAVGSAANRIHCLRRR